MGLFSSKKKTYVDTAVMRIVEDSAIPNSLLIGGFKSIVKERPLVASVQQEVFNGAFQKFERMYRYAERGDYFYGLPNARILSSDDGAAAAKAAIEADVGGPVSIDYVYFRPLNHVHEGRRYLTDNYGYNTETNQLDVLTDLKGFRVYLKDLVATYHLEPGAQSDSLSKGIWGRSPRGGATPTRLSGFSDLLASLISTQDWREGPGEVDGVEATFVWEDDERNIYEESLFIDLTSFTDDREYYQAQYRHGGNTYYWTYSPDTGLHPALDSVFDLNYTNPGSYFPFAMFRHHKQDRTADGLENTDEFRSTEKLLSYLGMDFKQMGESIHENPDIDDIEQAVMMMAVPITSEDQIELDYLFRFFRGLYDISPQSGDRFRMIFRPLSTGETESYALEIADADFRVVISYTAISRRLYPGNIGSVGTVTNTLSQEKLHPVSFLLNVPDEPVNVRTFTKQISRYMLEEIKVFAPTTRYDIYDGKGVLGGAEDERLLIPLNFDITQELNILDREYLYYRSLHLVANARVTQKIRWYESDWFKAVLTIVAVVLTIMSFGATWQSIALAASAGATALATALLTLALDYLVMAAATQVVVKFLGPEAAMILAAVAAIWGGAKMLTNAPGQDVWAENLMKASTGLASAVNTEMKELMADFNAEASAFELLQEEKWAELEEVKSLLDTSAMLDPFAFVGEYPLAMFNESPTDYYERTVHAGNAGPKGSEIVENYVQMALKLPTIGDVLG